MITHWLWKQTKEDSEERADQDVLSAYNEQQGIFGPSETTPPPLLTRSYLKTLWDQGKVLFQKESEAITVRPGQSLPFNTQVSIHFPKTVPLSFEPVSMDLHFLYEDEHIAVVNKPPGLSVHPSETEPAATLVQGLLYQIPNLSGINGVARPGIVHRIDKNTSGALVIAKTDRAHIGLAPLFANHTIERTYWAWGYGAPLKLELDKKKTLKTKIGRHPTDRKKMSVTVSEGRDAISHVYLKNRFLLNQRDPFASFFEIRLETGRTHQVRAHLAFMGHSLLGDPSYGTPSLQHDKWKKLPDFVKNAVSGLPGQALHARVLGFKHPITGEYLKFEAPLHKSLIALQEALFPYAEFSERLGSFMK